MPYLLLALAVGLVLLLLPGKRETDTSATALASDPTEPYRQTLERELEELLCELGGVRQCRVLLTLEQGYTYVYAFDSRESIREGEKQIEKTVLLQEQNGNRVPILLQEKPPVVSGVAVVCEQLTEAQSARMRDLLQALFCLPGERISIQS